MRDAVVPAAQIVTPNQFELEFLTGRSTDTLAEVLAAADARASAGPGDRAGHLVVHDEATPDTIDMIAVTGEGAWSVTTPLLPARFTGAGDLTAAMFLAHLLSHRARSPQAVGRTAAVVYGVLKATVDSGVSELQLVAAQDEIAAPTQPRSRSASCADVDEPGERDGQRADPAGDPTGTIVRLSRSSTACRRTRLHGWGPGKLRARAARRSVPEDLDVGAERVEPVGQVLVAAVDHVHVAQHRLTARREHAEQDADGRPQRRRADDLLTAPAGRPLDDHPVRVEQLHVGAEPVQLGQVDGPVLVHPVVDHRLALRRWPR